VPGDLESTDVQALTVLYSPDARVVGRCEALPPRRFELGRTPTAPGLAIDESMISRVHAAVDWDPGRERHLLRDMGSRNGSSVNGDEVQTALLVPGDVIRIGDTVLRYGRLHVNIVGWEAPPDSLLKGRSLGLRRLLDQVARVARSDVSVVLEGETGSGKELAARELHRLAGSAGPFRVLHCAGLQESEVELELFGGPGRGAHASNGASGLLRSAAGGSLLLDGVDELPPGLQARLLRALDSSKPSGSAPPSETPAPPRLLASTTRDLSELARAGAFRGDLYARIAAWTLRVPALRERPEDIFSIVEHTLGQQEGGCPHELSGDVFEALALYKWPFNVRELISVVQGASLMSPGGGRLALEHLPPDLRPHGVSEGSFPVSGEEGGGPLPAPGSVPSSQEMRGLLAHCGGNLSAAADHLGVDRAQVFRWLRRYGLDPDEFRLGEDEQ